MTEANICYPHNAWGWSKPSLDTRLLSYPVVSWGSHARRLSFGFGGSQHLHTSVGWFCKKNWSFYLLCSNLTNYSIFQLYNEKENSKQTPFTLHLQKSQGLKSQSHDCIFVHHDVKDLSRFEPQAWINKIIVSPCCPSAQKENVFNLRFCAFFSEHPASLNKNRRDFCPLFGGHPELSRPNPRTCKCEIVFTQEWRPYMDVWCWLFLGHVGL